MNNLIVRLARWLRRKMMPAALTSDGPAFALEAYRQHRAPSPAELLVELKSTAWTCASINAAACASLPPRLYVTTGRTQPPPRCATRTIEPALLRQLRAAHPERAAHAIEEVVDHPLLTLFRQVNPVHNAFHLFCFSIL